jgi:hypothetical protein
VVQKLVGESRRSSSSPSSVEEAYSSRPRARASRVQSPDRASRTWRVDGAPRSEAARSGTAAAESQLTFEETSMRLEEDAVNARWNRPLGYAVDTRARRCEELVVPASVVAEYIGATGRRAKALPHFCGHGASTYPQLLCRCPQAYMMILSGKRRGAKTLPWKAAEGQEGREDHGGVLVLRR